MPRFVAPLLAALAMFASPASAAPDRPFIALGRATQAPRGFIEMCRSERTFCGPSAGAGMTTMVTGAIAPAPEAAAATAAAAAADGTAELARIAAVNRFVNGHVAQRTDRQVYGQDEIWHRSGTGRAAAGDCEDIAIEKRFALIAAGVAPGTLSFAVVYMPRVGLHAVLIARTAAGDMVLDSRSPYVTRWDRTPYSWVSIQSASDPMDWRAPGARPIEIVDNRPAEGPAA